MSDNRQIALVTAAAGAIGSATTERLVEHGYHVVGADISTRRLNNLAERLGDSFTEAPCDVTTESGARQAVEATRDAADTQPGTLTGLVNVAGGVVGDVGSFYDKGLEDIDLEEWEAIFRLNLVSTYLVTQAAVSLMKENRRGSIVNVASMAYTGTHEQMGNPAYDAAKAGVVALTRTLARMLGSKNVRVNAVAPGITLGGLLREKMPHEMLDRHARETPLRRIGEPENVASVASFLLTQESSHVTGEVIHVSGGLR